MNGERVERLGEIVDVAGVGRHDWFWGWMIAGSSVGFFAAETTHYWRLIDDGRSR